jgi:thymidine phosphorylase
VDTSNAGSYALTLTPSLTLLGYTFSAGNAVEIMETILYLRGDRREHRLHRVVMTLAGHMLVMGQIAKNQSDGEKMAERALVSGAASDIFERIIATQGGPKNILDTADNHIPRAPIIRDIVAPCDGFVAGMKTRDIGLLLTTMHAGRADTSDKIDPVTGFDHVAPIGTKLEAGKTILARVHARDDAMAARAMASYSQLIEFSDTQPKHGDLVYGS